MNKEKRKGKDKILFDYKIFGLDLEMTKSKLLINIIAIFFIGLLIGTNLNYRKQEILITNECNEFILNNCDNYKMYNNNNLTPSIKLPFNNTNVNINININKNNSYINTT